jgi:hypothetical protein
MAKKPVSAVEADILGYRQVTLNTVFAPHKVRDILERHAQKETA